MGQTGLRTRRWRLMLAALAAIAALGAAGCGGGDEEAFNVRNIRFEARRVARRAKRRASL